jgi:hypothetical protein
MGRMKASINSSAYGRKKLTIENQIGVLGNRGRQTSTAAATNVITLNRILSVRLCCVVRRGGQSSITGFLIFFLRWLASNDNHVLSKCGFIHRALRQCACHPGILQNPNIRRAVCRRSLTQLVFLPFSVTRQDCEKMASLSTSSGARPVNRLWARL